MRHEFTRVQRLLLAASLGVVAVVLTIGAVTLFVVAGESAPLFATAVMCAALGIWLAVAAARSLRRDNHQSPRRRSDA